MNNKIVLVASAVGGVVALIGFITWASAPEYVPLYTGMSAQDANVVSDKLRELNVPFRLLAGGTSIEVPQAQHDEMILKLSQLNIQPTNGDAAWGSDKDSAQASSMVPTQEMENESIRKSRENEVNRIISHMQPISSARVMYTPGDSSPYSVDADKHEPTASVIVSLKPGQSLSEENVQAIVRLVQMAFKGLSDQKITVSDTHAQMLWDGTQSGHYGENMLAKQQRDEEKFQANKLQAELNRIWPNKTVVHVHVEKSRDHRVIHKTTTEDGAVTSTTKESEQFKGASADAARAAGAGATANGVAAAAPATPGIPVYPGSGGDNAGNYTHETKTETRAPSMVDTTTQEDPGKIEKFTVSAFVDKSVPTEDIPKIQAVLASAIGVTPNDPTQARQVTVEQVAFDVPRSEPEARPSENLTRSLSLIVPLALMLVCFFLLARALKMPARMATSGQLALQGAGMTGSFPAFEASAPSLAITGDTSRADGSLLGALAPAKPGAIGVPIGDNGPKMYDVIEEAFDSNLESILHMARSKPETVSALLKSWITDES